MNRYTSKVAASVVSALVSIAITQAAHAQGNDRGMEGLNLPPSDMVYRLTAGPGSSHVRMQILGTGKVTIHVMWPASKEEDAKVSRVVTHGFRRVGTATREELKTLKTALARADLGTLKLPIKLARKVIKTTEIGEWVSDESDEWDDAPEIGEWVSDEWDPDARIVSRFVDTYGDVPDPDFWIKRRGKLVEGSRDHYGDATARIAPLMEVLDRIQERIGGDAIQKAADALAPANAKSAEASKHGMIRPLGGKDEPKASTPSNEIARVPDPVAKSSKAAKTSRPKTKRVTINRPLGE